MRRLTALLTATAAAITLSAPAEAQQDYLQNDQAALYALDIMYQTLGSYCMAGDPVGCQATQYVADLAGYLWNASQACEWGDEGACYAYMQAYWQLDSDYGQFTAYFAQFDYSAYGSTHEERLAGIRAHGQAILAQGYQNSAILDQRHQQFLDYLRN